MDKRLIVLKLFLKELGVPSDIDTRDDRKRVQKAMYLAQALSACDLGYRFGWYLMGPYSSQLTKDYYEFAAASSAGDNDFEKQVLRSDLRRKLDKITPLMQPPKEIAKKVSQEDWLELVASWHYLLNVSKYDEQKSQQIIEKEKNHVAPYLAYAKNALASLG